MNYSYRSIYDTVKLLKKIDNLKKIKVDENTYLKNYFSTLNYFGITTKKIRNFKENKSYMFFFRFINGNYYFKKYYQKVLSGIWKIERFFYKIKVFIKDYEYRKYLKCSLLKVNCLFPCYKSLLICFSVSKISSLKKFFR